MARSFFFHASLASLLTMAVCELGAENMPPAAALGVGETQPPQIIWNSVNRGSLRAIIQPAQDIRLSARAAGVIQRYLAEEGETVKKRRPHPRAR